MSSSLFQNNQPTQQNSPQIDQRSIDFVKGLLAKNGMSAEQMVKAICQQRGIDLDALINQFK